MSEINSPSSLSASSSSASSVSSSSVLNSSTLTNDDTAAKPYNNDVAKSYIGLNYTDSLRLAEVKNMRPFTVRKDDKMFAKYPSPDDEIQPDRIWLEYDKRIVVKALNR